MPRASHHQILVRKACNSVQSVLKLAYGAGRQKTTFTAALGTQNSLGVLLNLKLIQTKVTSRQDIGP